MKEIYFISEGHKERFLTGLMRIGKIYSGRFDQEYSAAMYLLSAHSGTWEAAQEYISRTGIDLPTMIETGYHSTGEAILINLAGNLFNGNLHIDPLEFMSLDEKNFQLALSAIKIRRFGIREVDHTETLEYAKDEV